MRWAKGKNAYSICQRCGFTCKYTERKTELSGLIVCEECYDGKYQIMNHPLNKQAPFRIDAPLKNPYPDAALETPTSLPYNTWDLIR